MTRLNHERESRRDRLRDPDPGWSHEKPVNPSPPVSYFRRLSAEVWRHAPLASSDQPEVEVIQPVTKRRRAQPEAPATLAEKRATNKALVIAAEFRFQAARGQEPSLQEATSTIQRTFDEHRAQLGADSDPSVEARFNRQIQRIVADLKAATLSPEQAAMRREGLAVAAEMRRQGLLRGWPGEKSKASRRKKRGK